MLMQRWLDAAGIAEPELRRSYLAVMDRVRSASLASPEMKALRLWMSPLPAALRPHWMAIAAVIRLADLEADTGDHETRLRRLDAWLERVLAAIRAGGSDEPLLHATAHTFDVWKLETPYLEECFGAARRDTVFTPFARTRSSSAGRRRRRACCSCSAGAWGRTPARSRRPSPTCARWGRGSRSPIASTISRRTCRTGGSTCRSRPLSARVTGPELGHRGAGRSP